MSFLGVVRIVLDDILNMWNNQYQFAAHNYYAMNAYQLAPFYIPYPIPDATLPVVTAPVKMEQLEPTYSLHVSQT